MVSQCLSFECAACGSPDPLAVLRRCPHCGHHAIAGYACDCGHQDFDPKATGKTTEGLPALILGLSGENMARLMADEPIVIETEKLGLPPMRIWIIGGRTESAILADLRKHFPVTIKRGEQASADERPKGHD
jgi:hypothetical protein